MKPPETTLFPQLVYPLHTVRTVPAQNNRLSIFLKNVVSGFLRWVWVCIAPDGREYYSLCIIVVQFRIEGMGPHITARSRRSLVWGGGEGVNFQYSGCGGGWVGVCDRLLVGWVGVVSHSHNYVWSDSFFASCWWFLGVGRTSLCSRRLYISMFISRNPLLRPFSTQSVSQYREVPGAAFVVYHAVIA